MTLEDVLENQPEEVKHTFNQLRDILINMSPKPEESFMGGSKVRMSSYSLHKKMVCVIGPAKDHCKLYLHHTDKVNTGTLKLEGKGKHAKTVKVSTFDKEQFTVIRSVINEIVEMIDQNQGIYFSQ